jgi:hypothetical protein
MVEIQAPLEKQHGMRAAPNLFKEHRGFCARKDQSNAIAVIGKTRKPAIGFRSVRRVAPHATVPGLFQPVVENRVVLTRHRPRPVLRRARVKVKLTKRCN